MKLIYSTAKVVIKKCEKRSSVLGSICFMDPDSRAPCRVYHVKLIKSSYQWHTFLRYVIRDGSPKISDHISITRCRHLLRSVKKKGNSTHLEWQTAQ